MVWWIGREAGDAGSLGAGAGCVYFVGIETEGIEARPYVERTRNEERCEKLMQDKSQEGVLNRDRV